MARKHRYTRNARSEIAATAARKLADGTACDFDTAKRKAARELGQDERRNLPDNREVHDALVEYLTVFGGNDHEIRVLRLRQAALAAMEYLDCFRPRLCGPVLYGTAGDNDPITLHLFAGEVEAVTRFFLDRRVAFELAEAPFRFRRDDGPERVSVFHVEFAGEPFELAVFADDDAGRQPLSPIDGRPMQRLSRSGLQALVDSREVFHTGRARRSAAL